jgi:hypothetical protein
VVGVPASQKRRGRRKTGLGCDDMKVKEKEESRMSYEPMVWK